jgi:hypothetical protein
MAPGLHTWVATAADPELPDAFFEFYFDESSGEL